VYRGFNIGTAKVPEAGRRGIPHHLLDVVSADEVFTAGDYRRMAAEVLSGVKRRRRVPIIVGGTGLYLRALLMGLFEGPSRSQELRMRLRGLVERRGQAFLHRLLQRFDPKVADRIHPNDTPKIIRAIEVYLLARQPISRMQESSRAGLQGFRVIKLGLNPDRKQLAARINARVERMFAGGLLEETRTIVARLEPSEVQSFRPLGALGYRQALAVLRGELNLQEAIRKTQTATRRYAKRQMTWFRKEPDIRWFDGFGDDPKIFDEVLNWLRQALPASSIRAQ
jgi:tRNA dimethylallyltransferase